MGSKHYDFLNSSLLFNQNSISNNFKNESEERIFKELENYREFVLSNINEIGGDIGREPSTLRVFSTEGTTPISVLKQTALYVNQFIISDPLFKFTKKETQMETAMDKYLGMDKKSLNKRDLVMAVKYLKEITPMVAGNFVKVFPVEYYFEGPEQLPLKYSENLFEDILVEDISKIYKSKALVSNLEKSEKGYIIFDKQPLVPGRAIAINFDDIGNLNGKIYFLMESKILSYDEETRIVNYAQYLPETPPSIEEFDNWVKQSINQAAISHFESLNTKLALSFALKGNLLVNETFDYDLLGAHMGHESSIENYTTNQMLNIDLPFMDKIDTQKLMQIREHEADIFTNFRIELEKGFREIRTISDPELLKQKTENLFHELNTVQGQKIKQKLNHVKKQMLLNTSILIGGLAGSIPSGGYSLFATALATLKGYKDYREYSEKVKENPAYFLWKVKKS